MLFRSHDVQLLPGLGKRCYVQPCLLRRTEWSPKWPHFTPTYTAQWCHLSQTQLGVPLPTQHVFNSMQACNSKERSPFPPKTSPPCKNSGPLSCKMCVPLCSNVYRRDARDLPCDPKLPQAAHPFAHDVRMLPGLGKHCYVQRCLVRRM